MKNSAKSSLLAILVIIFLGILGIKALFHPGFYTNHDGEHQIIRLFHFDQALKDGQLPPRWAGTADNGYGYPLFTFSYQSPWFIGVPLLRMGFSLADAVKGVFIAGFLLSGIFMFLWLKEMLGVLPAFSGAFVFLWAPYRFSNIFVRASLGEATAFLFIPLLFWGIWQCKNHQEWQKGIVLTSLGLAGIILSHLMVLVVFVIPLALWAIMQIIGSDKKEKTFKVMLLSLVLGLGICAYYFIPAIVEKQYTVASGLLQSHFLNHFVTLKQLIYSRWGYGFDLPGTVNDEMSFQIGIVQWLAIILIAIITVIIIRQKKKNSIGFLFFTLVIFVFSVLMMLSVSQALWEQITHYAYFDFPWRFLGLAVFSASLAAALVVYHLKRLGWFFVLLFLLIGFYTNRNHLRVNQYVYQPDYFYTNNLQTTNQFDEYRPKTLNTDYIKVKRKKIETDGDMITIQQQNISSNHILLQGNANQKSTIKINTTYYPGWQVWLNGQEEVNIQTDEGVMEVSIPQGAFTLEAEFKDTPIRKIANSISILFLIFLVILVFKLKK